MWFLRSCTRKSFGTRAWMSHQPSRPRSWRMSFVMGCARGCSVHYQDERVSIQASWVVSGRKPSQSCTSLERAQVAAQSPRAGESAANGDSQSGATEPGSAEVCSFRNSVHSVSMAEVRSTDLRFARLCSLKFMAACQGWGGGHEGDGAYSTSCNG